MDKIAHGEGAWKVIRDVVDSDSKRSIFVMNSHDFRLLCKYVSLIEFKDVPDDTSEGWHRLNGWEFLVRDDVECIARVKY